MPVSVTIPDREKKAAAQMAPAALDDYEHPSEKREGTKAFGIWILLFVVLIGVLAIWPSTRGLSIGIFAWWLLSCIAYFFIGPKMVLRRLRMHDTDLSITTKSQPRLQALLNKGAGVLGIESPDGYVLPEGISQVRVFTPPAFVLVTQATLDLLQANELDCLVLRQLVHLRQNHARRLMLLKLLSDTSPALRLLAWPVGFYGFLLRMWWSDLAEMTADRLTLLIVKNHKTLISALLKQQTATDPLMGQFSVTTADVDAYVEQEGNISLEGREISTQYKLGQAIHENPYLEERLQELASFARSQEFRDAVTKLSEAKTNKTAKTK